MLGLARMTPPTELDEITLARAVRGDAAATRALVVLYEVRVFALVSRMVGGRARATVEDIAQDTFVAVFRRLGGFDPRGGAKLSTWILTIAARRAIDELRRRRPEPIADVDPPGIARADERARQR